MNSTDHVTTLLILWAAPVQVAFVIVYGIWSPWTKSAIGRALMVKSTGLALVLGLAFAYYFWGADYAGRPWIRLVVYGLVVTGIVYQFLALLAAKWRGWRDHRKANGLLL